MDAVAEIDIEVGGWPEHDPGARGGPGESMRGRVLRPEVGFHLGEAHRHGAVAHHRAQQQRGQLISRPAQIRDAC